MEQKNIECESCSNESTKRINTLRFIDRLDMYFKDDDLNGAKEHLDYWENEARVLGDKCGLLTVLNEKIGFSRRINDKDMAINALEEALKLLEEREQFNNVSGATICVNIATTLKAFNRVNEALPIYDKAESVFIEKNMTDSYEYASLLNNRASAYEELKRYDEAEESLLKAFDILQTEGKHDGEVSLTLISLAHVIYDRDEDVNRVEKTLDIAIEYLESTKQAHDANYAYILEKIIPSLRYFKREELADKYETIVKEIYRR